MFNKRSDTILGQLSTNEVPSMAKTVFNLMRDVKILQERKLLGRWDSSRQI